MGVRLPGLREAATVTMADPEGRDAHQALGVDAGILEAARMTPS